MKSWDNGRVWLGIYHYIPSETRPLSNGITAAFGSVYITTYTRSFVQYLSYLLDVSPYVSSFVQYLSYLLNVSLYVSSFEQYLSSQRFSVSSFVCTVFVLSSQRFSAH